MLAVVFSILPFKAGLDYFFGDFFPSGLLAQVPGGRVERKVEEKSKPVSLETAASGSMVSNERTVDMNNDSKSFSQPAIDTMVKINTRFAYVAIALAGLTCIVVLLLLIRFGGVRAAVSKVERDIMHIKEALRYLMEVPQHASSEIVQKAMPNLDASVVDKRNDAVLLRMVAEIERLSRRMDALPRPSTSSGKQLYTEEEVSREVQRRLDSMRIETIEPAPGDIYDAVLHEEVDIKPSRSDQDGTIFRVIQNGLVYNSRVALKARVVVHKA
jgi:hypothetical protein